MELDSLAPVTAIVQQAEETEAQLIQAAIRAVRGSNIEIGRCASIWTTRYANGRGDSAFAELIGTNQPRVNEARRVYETFGDLSDSDKLSWSHYVFALRVDDPADAIQQAVDHDMKVPEFRAWIRMQKGEDLAESGDDLPEGVDEAADQPHVGDVDPYQSPGTIVVPTPKDGGDDGRQTDSDTGRTEVSGGDAPTHGESPGEVGERAKRESGVSRVHQSGDSGNRASSERSGEASLESVLDTVRSLIDSLKPKLHDKEPQKLAAKLRRWANELDPQPEPEDETEKSTKLSVTAGNDESSSAAIVATEWNSLHGVTHCRLVTAARRQKINLRLKDPFWRDNWREAMLKVQESSFCTGKNDRGWKADLDWFIKPGTVVSVMEGKHDDKRNVTAGNSHLDGLNEWASEKGDVESPLALTDEEIPF